MSRSDDRVDHVLLIKGGLVLEELAVAEMAEVNIPYPFDATNSYVDDPNNPFSTTQKQ